MLTLTGHFPDRELWRRFADRLLEAVAGELELQGPEALFDSPGELDVRAEDGRILHSEATPTGLALRLRYDYRRQIGGAGSNRTPFWESGELDVLAWLDPDTGALTVKVAVEDAPG